jgi:hypothetical protein
VPEQPQQIFLEYSPVVTWLTILTVKPLQLLELVAAQR